MHTKEEIFMMMINNIHNTTAYQSEAYNILHTSKTNPNLAYYQIEDLAKQVTINGGSWTW